MNSGADESRLAPLAAILKVLARWAPHTRHDLVGACSPISLDLSLLAVKSAKGPMSAEDIAPFVKRGKESVRITVQQCNRIAMLQQQDRTQTVSIDELLENMARSMRTVFAGVEWKSPAAPDDLGSDSEYDLTIVVCATMLALFDRHGAHTQLRMTAGVSNAELVLDFSTTPASGEASLGAAAKSAAIHRIDFDDVRHLAEYLGFNFAERGNGIELRRLSAQIPDGDR